MESKDKWINEVMNSLDGIQPPPSGESLHEKIFGRLSVSEPRIFYLLPYQRWVAAACILILLGLNVITLIKYRESKPLKNTAAMQNPVYAEYFSFLNEF